MKIKLNNKSWWIVQGQQSKATPHFLSSVYNRGCGIIACNIDDKGIGIWDVSTGRLTHCLEGHVPSGRLRWPGFAISAALKCLIMVHDDVVMFKDLTSGGVLHSLIFERSKLEDPEAMKLEGLCLSDDESLLAVTDCNANVYLFEMSSLEQISVLRGSVASPMMCRISANNQWLAATGDGELIVWNLNHDQQQFNTYSPMINEQAHDLLFTADHRFLVLPGFSESVQVLDIEKKTLRRPECEDMAFAGLSPDDRLYLHTSKGEWFTQSLTESDLQPLDPAKAPHNGAHTPSQFSSAIPADMKNTLLERFPQNTDEFGLPERKYKWLLHLAPAKGVALVRWDKSVLRYDLKRLEVDRAPQLPPLHSTLYHERRDQFIGCDGDDLVFLDKELSQIVHRLKTRDSIKAYALSHDGRLAYCAFLSDAVVVFEIETGLSIGRLQHDYNINGLAVSNDGLFLYALASGDIYGWDLTTGKRLFVNEDVIPGNQETFLLDPNGDCLYIANRHELTVYATVEAIKIKTLTRHEAEINHICWSSDGSRIFTSDNSGKIAWWDLRSNTTGTLTGDQKAVEYMFSSNSKLYSFDQDAILRCWDERTGALQVIWVFQPDGVAIFDHDGYHHSNQFTGVEGRNAQIEKSWARLMQRCPSLRELRQAPLFSEMEDKQQSLLATAFVRLFEIGWTPGPGDILKSAIEFLLSQKITPRSHLAFGALNHVLSHPVLNELQQKPWDDLKQKMFMAQPVPKPGDSNIEDDYSNAAKDMLEKVRDFEERYKNVLNNYRYLYGASSDKEIGAYFDVANLDFGFVLAGKEKIDTGFGDYLKQVVKGVEAEEGHMENEEKYNYSKYHGIQDILDKNPNLKVMTSFIELILHESFHLYQTICLNSARDYMTGLRSIRYARLSMFALHSQNGGSWNKGNRGETVFTPFMSLPKDQIKLILEDIHYAEIGLEQIANTYHEEETGADGLHVIDLLEGGAFYYQKLVLGDYDVTTPDNPLYIKAYDVFSRSGGYNRYLFVLMTHVALRYGSLRTDGTFSTYSPVAVFRILLESVEDCMGVIKDGLTLPSNILTRDPRNVKVIERMIKGNQRLRKGISMFLHLIALMEQKVAVRLEIKGSSFKALNCLGDPCDKHFSAIVRELIETFPAATEDAFLIAMMLEPSLAIKYACWCMTDLLNMELINDFGMPTTVAENRVPMDAIHQFLELIETGEAECCENHPRNSPAHEILNCNDRLGLPNMIMAITGRSINDLYR